MIDLNQALKFSQKLALQVGKTLLKRQEDVQIKAYKDRQDIVTNIDLEAEKLIINAIEKQYPNHNIVSEEKGKLNKKSDYIWYIDPLDGTKEYFRGLPIFNINITLEQKQETLLGLVYMPKTNQLFTAIKGQGAFENAKKIKVSKEKELKNSFIYTQLPNYKMSLVRTKKIWSTMDRLSRLCYRLRSFQADILSLCWLAQGGLEGFFVFEMEKWWDVGAGILIIQEAGGKVTNIKGELIKNRDTSEGIVASNGKIHDQLIEILNS